MAANRFATMLHRNTNKITLILIYAVLEWVLIVLLLLNSLFSYLIIKFAEFFGLKPPCPWCTRIDHFFDSAKGDKNMNSDSLCEVHSKEISKLGFCSVHQKLVVSEDMCGDCLSSRPEIEGSSRNLGLLWKNRGFGDFQGEKEKVGENGEVSLNCSCCGVSLSNNNDDDKYSSYVLLKTSSWDDVLKYAHKENLIPESEDFAADGVNVLKNDVLENKSENQMISELDGNLGNADNSKEENGFISVTVNELIELERGANENSKDKSVQVCVEEDKSLENSTQHLEFFLDYSGHKLVPIELSDLVTDEHEIVENAKIEEDDLTEGWGVESEVQVKENENVVVFESGTRNESRFLDVDINEDYDLTKDREVGSEVQVKENKNVVVFESGTRKESRFLDVDIKEEDDFTKDREVESEVHVKENENVVVFESGTRKESRFLDVDINEEDDLTKDREVESEVQVKENENVVVFESGTRKENRFLDVDINEEVTYEMLESMEIEEDENSLVFHAKGSCLEKNEFEHFGVFPLTQWPLEETCDVQELGGAEMETHSDAQMDNVACEEASQGNNENEADVSIGTEIPDLDITDEIEIENAEHSYESIHEDLVTSSANLDDHGPTQIEEQPVEMQFVSIQDSEHMPKNQPTFQMELNETKEDKIPDTPSSIDLDKKLQLLEKRDSGTEESIDGSITSEFEGSEGFVSIERLKTALRAERKALQALYAELEEERSASAVATNQTMAMINRLQEEKAAMQMEALQYQRMMEEQSEYDQEALQLLNEIMMKREKEKQEVERELEVCRKKLSDYETREKIRVLKKSRDGFSSASCSNAEDSDGLSIDLNQEVKDEVGILGNSDFSNQNTPVDAVVNLEESLADFEEERLAILEQLKVLEEKLVTLDDDNGEICEDVNGSDNLHENGHSNGYSNGKYSAHTRIGGQNGKSLLPLFDAISDENGDGIMMNGNGVDHDSGESNFEMENKRDAIEDEVDHLYERLQALEADREFLKHCISSLKKGDKGMDLLQEILQHLRDLRNVELRVKNFGDAVV